MNSSTDCWRTVEIKTMTTEDLARIVQDMRHAQKTYFRTKSQAALRESKALEAKVDRCCRVVLGGQGTLFEEKEAQ